MALRAKIRRREKLRDKIVVITIRARLVYSETVGQLVSSDGLDIHSGDCSE